MAYQIEAFIKDGMPTLNIWDYNRHKLCMSWTYDRKSETTWPLPNCEIQSLFRKLLLLTLKDDISNVRVFKIESGDEFPISLDNVISINQESNARENRKSKRNN